MKEVWDIFYTNDNIKNRKKRTVPGTCICKQLVDYEVHLYCLHLILVSYTVKPAHAVTSIKQSPVSKGHHFLILS
jgi:hypothetical protein